MEKPIKLDNYQIDAKAKELSDNNSAYKLARLYIEKSECFEEVKYQLDKDK